MPYKKVISWCSIFKDTSIINYEFSAFYDTICVILLLLLDLTSSRWFDCPELKKPLTAPSTVTRTSSCTGRGPVCKAQDPWPLAGAFFHIHCIPWALFFICLFFGEVIDAHRGPYFPTSSNTGKKTLTLTFKGQNLCQKETSLKK